jgi:hypothetical protein
VSFSEADHQTPMKRSIGKRIEAASWIATWFITPQPHMVTKSGRSRRTCSQVAFCSCPGWSTGSSTSSKPCFSASDSSVRIGSLP